MNQESKFQIDLDDSRFQSLLKNQEKFGIDTTSTEFLSRASSNKQLHGLKTIIAEQQKQKDKANTDLTVSGGKQSQQKDAVDSLVNKLKRKYKQSA